MLLGRRKKGKGEKGKGKREKGKGKREKGKGEENNNSVFEKTVPNDISQVIEMGILPRITGGAQMVDEILSL